MNVGSCKEKWRSRPPVTKKVASTEKTWDYRKLRNRYQRSLATGGILILLASGIMSSRLLREVSEDAIAIMSPVPELLNHVGYTDTNDCIE
jgi:hypothetical protein